MKSTSLIIYNATLYKVEFFRMLKSKIQSSIFCSNFTLAGPKKMWFSINSIFVKLVFQIGTIIYFKKTGMERGFVEEKRIKDQRNGASYMDYSPRKIQKQYRKDVKIR